MELISSKLCMTQNIGVHGNLFGGTLMSWFDEAGAIMASQVCRTSKMVTAKFEEMKFHKPVKEKHNVRIYGEVCAVGMSSISLKLEAKRLNIYDSTEETVCSTKAVFVRIDTDGRPRPIDLEIRQKYENLGFTIKPELKPRKKTVKKNEKTN